MLFAILYLNFSLISDKVLRVVMLFTILDLNTQ